MKAPALLSSIAMLALTQTAYAKWYGSIYESGAGVRQASLTGIDDSDNEKQAALLCTSSGTAVSPRLSLIFSLPATGQYTVRIGDSAHAVATIAESSWEFDLTVDTNSSSGFTASSDTIHVAEIVRALASSQSDLSAIITAGPIEASYAISAEIVGEEPVEWLEACSN